MRAAARLWRAAKIKQLRLFEGTVQGGEVPTLEDGTQRRNDDRVAERPSPCNTCHVGVGLRAPVLILSRHYQPVRLSTARQAFELLFIGRAAALDGNYQSYDFEAWAGLPIGLDDESVGTTQGPLRVPRLIVLSTQHQTRPAMVPLTRRNVFLRDGFVCQYCESRLAVKDLSLDHVVPRSRGGGSTWDNLVTACRRCNRVKGHKLAAECGMEPVKKPARPRWSTVVQDWVAPRRFEEWDPFLVAC